MTSNKDAMSRLTRGQPDATNLRQRFSRLERAAIRFLLARGFAVHYPEGRAVSDDAFGSADAKTSAKESGSDSFEEKNPTEGLPDDLARVLRDQSVIVPQDAAVWELLAMLAKWQNAPSDTASADLPEESDA
jgi:hypothetical protein